MPLVIAVVALLGWVLPAVPASATATATLVSGAVVPRSPPRAGVVRLGLGVRNDTASAWTAGDLVHLTWKGADGKQVAADARPLGQAVAPAATVDLALVTLSPTAVGDFTLTTELETRGSRLQIGDPTAYHLSGCLCKGRGNGHGLGMSQWGARGRAGAGDDYKKILAAYYNNSRIDSRDTSGLVRIALTHGAIDLARPWPRVFGAMPFVAEPVTVDGYPQLSGQTGQLLAFDASPGGLAEAFLQSADGVRGTSVSFNRPLVIHSASAAGIRTNILQTMGGDFRSGAEQWRYGGELRLIPKGGANVLPVSVLPIEDYLKGVVPAEMPPYWGVEALKAQAIAARTYAMRKISGSGDFDLEGNQFDQAYSGLTEQVKASNDAVDATRGQVLTYNGQLLSALYMASGGGHTENSEYGFIHLNHGLKPAANLPYLRGIADPLDRAPSWQVGPFSTTHAAQSLPGNDEDLGDRLGGIGIPH